MSSSNDIPRTINGGPQHRSTVSNMTTSDFPDVLGNDELAANLIKCATYVKLGETHHPLLRQTINDLTYFVTGKQVKPPTTTTSTNGGISGNVPNIKNQDSPASNSVLAKKSVSQLASGMISILGSQRLTDDNSSVGVGSVSGRSEAQRSASSMKHAENARADIQRTFGSSSSSDNSRVVTGEKKLKKPPFQRPTNTSSSLIANGWIEQQRRSKLRVVWKEVLASLVEGRKAGEETTLWIQREYYSNTTNKMELEALHQIPIKLIRHIEYQGYTTDHKFLIKVHNMHEDFMFRCEKSEEAAQNWVITIQSVLDIIKDQNRSKNGDSKIPIRAALEQAHLQQERERHASNESSASKNDDSKFPAHVASTTFQTNVPQQQQHQHAPKVPPPPVATPYSHQPPATSIPHMTVTEMRAIAHGAGIQTHGMERGELELIVQQISNSLLRTEVSGGVSPPPPQPQPTSSNHFAVPPPPTPPVPTRPVADPTLQRSSSAEEEMAKQRQQQEAIDRQQQIEEAARRRKLADDAARNRAAAEAQQAYVRQQQEAIEKQQRAEEERKRLEAERLRREEDEHQRRVAEQQVAEQRRKVEEQQRQQQEQWKQQQGNWQKQQVEEELRRRADEARIAEEKRRQEEAYRAQHQQWQQQQQQTNGIPPNQWQQPHPSAPPPYGQPPPPQYGPGSAQGPPQHPGPPNQHYGNSQVDQKYAKMATQVGDAGQQRSLQIIKHGILVEWALQPPAMQILRPIEVLITSVHVVFPPKYGVPGHEHFKKWSIVTLPEVLSGTQPDDEKLSKAVKKLRFVLHPDKLPREFTEEQTYMCRMIWDIVSDAFEDHKKREEELAWMR